MRKTKYHPWRHGLSRFTDYAVAANAAHAVAYAHGGPVMVYFDRDHDPAFVVACQWESKPPEDTFASFIKLAEVNPFPVTKVD